MNPCQHQSQLTAYLLGDLPEPAAAELRAHLEMCPECRATQAQLKATLSLLSEAFPADGQAPVLDAARRKQLLEIRPARAPSAGGNWFIRRHVSLGRIAATIVVGLGLFEIMSSALFPAVSNSPRAARRAQLAMAAKGAAAAAHAVSAESEPETRPTACPIEREARKALPAAPALNTPMPTSATASDKTELFSHYFRKADRDHDGDTRTSQDAENGRQDASKSAFSAWGEKRAVALGRELATDEKLAADSTPTARTHSESLAKALTVQDPQAKAASGPGASAEVTVNSFSLGKHPAAMKGVYASRSAGESRAAGVSGGVGGAVVERESDFGLAVARKLEETTVSKQDATAPEGKVRLNIALPKPQFTGTPKDIRNPNLETAADQLAEAANGYTYETVSAEKKSAPFSHGGQAARAEVSELGLDVGGVADKPAESVLKREEAKPSPADTDGDGAVVTLFAGTKIVANINRTPVAAAFNPFVATAAQPFSTFAMDVDTASYTLTRQAIRSGALPEPERVRTEEIVNAFDYGDTAPERAVFRVYQDGAQSRFGAGHNLLRIGVKGRRLGREEQRPAMLTFVIDVSGSMSQPDRIGLARLALSLLLDQLAERDRIQIIAYSDHARLVIEPVGASEKARVIAAFERLQCNGSTNLEEGLRQAYEQAARSFIPGAENRVILISDGVANLGADSAQEILDKVAANRKQGITCSVFGVGAGTYNDRLLEELADKGDGVYRFLDSEQEVRTAFVDDLAATLNTIAKDAKIQVEWNPAAVRQYRQLGYEKRALRKEQFRDDSVDAGEVGSGQSVTALYELELAPDVAPSALLGTVRIRYQRPDSGKVEEIEMPLLAESVLRPAHAASAHFRVAASAAEFAELLRGSPHAAGGRFEDVADYLRPAVLELSLDTRVKELLELIEASAAIKR